MPFDPTLRERLARAFPFRREETYRLATYPLFLKFFSENVTATDLTLENAKLAVVLVYTWMPLPPLEPGCWRHFASAKKMLLRDKVARLNADEIDTLKAFVGGSLLATSKFLHFLNPGRYAVWDVNIARAAYRCTWRQCNRANRYTQYLDDLGELELDHALRSRVHDALGAASELRYREFALYQLGVSESRSASAASRPDVADIPFAVENFTLDLGEEDGRY